MRDEPWLQNPVHNLLADCGRGLALDIGTNHGQWARFLQPLFRTLICVEPDERCAEIPGTEFYRCLVGAQKDQVTLWLSDRPEQNHVGEKHPLHGTSGRPVTLPQVTLEELCRGRVPDFVKIDVEGAEDAVLAGVTDPDRLTATAFIIESHAREAALSSILRQWGRPWEVIPHPDICPDHCWLAVPPLL